MRTLNGDEITQTDPHRHKFADALAEYAYDNLDWAYDATGDVDCPTGWFARLGDKRILRGDDRGFVWVEKFADKRGAETIYSALERLYYTWADEETHVDPETDEYDESAHLADIALVGEYVAYCYRSEENNAESFPFDQWVAWEDQLRPTFG